MSDDRIDKLEDRVETLGETVVEVRGTVARMDGKLDGITQTLTSLVRIEERQVSTNERLTSGAAKMGDQEARIRKLELSVPDGLDKRLSAIETAMPSLIESRKWVVMGVLAGIGMIGAGLVKLLFINP